MSIPVVDRRLNQRLYNPVGVGRFVLIVSWGAP
jgi:hypothetical protein